VALLHGDFAQAIRLCDTVPTHPRQPAHALTRFLRGLAHLEAGHYGLALRDFSDAIAADITYAQRVEALGPRPTSPAA
jgi:hypothetical protein